MPDDSNLNPVDGRSLSKELIFNFKEYANYVISERALPDARDGLKPVHRRILWAMYTMGLTPRSSFKKCARVVGETTGKYHPHAGGVYESLVRMAQPFSLRYPLVQGQGNFGSIDGFPAAAMRYTEARLSKISMTLLEGTQEETVEFQDNFDGEEREPTVLAAKIPQLLINGTSGIAVGMSSNLPPHNLNEVVEACLHLLRNPTADPSELLSYIKGPDFPTGGIIIGGKGIRDLYLNGRGSLLVRSKVKYEYDKKQKEHILAIVEIPYLVNKANLVEDIAEKASSGRIEGIKDVKDLSKENIRIEIILDDAFSDETSRNFILVQLYRLTRLQNRFSARNLAYVRGRPALLTLKGSLLIFLEHREKVVRRTLQLQLEKILLRLEILEGLIKALDHIDEVIQIIRESSSRRDAHNKLMEVFSLTDRQSKAVLEMPLHRLPRLEQDNLREEARELGIERERIQDILSDYSKLLDVIAEELTKILETFSEGRRTEIREDDLLSDVHLLPREREVLLTISRGNLIRSVTYDNFTVQNRGGKGIIGYKPRREDSLESFIVTSNHHTILLYSISGIVYKFNAYDIPLSNSRSAIGTPIKRFLKISEPIARVINIPPNFYEDDSYYLITLTKRGKIKRTALREFLSVNRNGKRGIVLREGDLVADIFIQKEGDDCFTITKHGRMSHFTSNDFRPTGRISQGVIGMRIKEEEDEVIRGFTVPPSMIKDYSCLLISENGYGKRSELKSFTKTKRGAQGVIAYKCNEKTGKVASAVAVPSSIDRDADLSIVNSNGIVIKVHISAFPILGRATSGVRIMRMSKGEVTIALGMVADEISS